MDFTPENASVRSMAEEMAAGLSRVTDAAQLEANNDVIRALAAQIVEAGDWPF